jgi:chemotaxis protein histidine kinase CheA
MAEVASTVESTEKPVVRRRRAAPKAAAHKPAGRRAAAHKPAARKAKPALSLKKASETAKEVAFVQLGICGKVYDEFNTRVSKARKDAPKRWSDLVKRGERVQRDLDKAQKDLTKDLRKRVNDMEIPTPIEEGVSKFRKAVRKLTKRVNKAA